MSPTSRADYRPPDYLVPRIELRFEIITRDECIVTAKMWLERAAADARTITLNGVGIELLRLELDGAEIPASRIRRDESLLVIADTPVQCVLSVTNRLRPTQNSGFMGLYAAGDVLLADTEPEGFRHITYFPDRPDIRPRFKVTLVADRDQYPVLLSNGECIATRLLSGNRHQATWDDPLPKSSHVFSIVAGKLARIDDSFTTRSGRQVKLSLFAAADEIDRCRDSHAILKRAMRWDEEVFGREYDLGVFNTVVIPDYNQGGMEYRGLNIFSSANFRPPLSGLDDETLIRAWTVIGHEYFHNWVGNRVGCRDWFNLTLKESLVVYKSQEFGAALLDPTLQRIADVKFLREHQFPEDDSATPQAPRPDHYSAAQNLYTRTTYEKGAEIVRMARLLLGARAFRAGCDRFHERHDFQAVQIEQFVQALAEAGDRDLGQFLRWYTQPGRPHVHVSAHYNESERTYTLTLEQKLPGSPGAATRLPFAIPVAIGLIAPDGCELPVTLAGETTPGPTTRVLEMTRDAERIEIVNVPCRPIPSLLRGFSAPVSLHFDWRSEDLAILAMRDTDTYGRWEASQQLLTKAVLCAVHGHDPESTRSVYIETVARILEASEQNPQLAGLQLRRPSEAALGQSMPIVDVEGIHRSRTALERALAEVLEDRLFQVYEANQDAEPSTFSPAAVGRRLLKNQCLRLLAMSGRSRWQQVCLRQLDVATNLTDAFGALAALLGSSASVSDDPVARFTAKWPTDGALTESLIALRASCERAEVAHWMRSMIDGFDFHWNSQTELRSLFDSFARNQIGFHEYSGAGYRLIAEIVRRLNSCNPRMAARALLGFNTLHRFDTRRQAMMRTVLHELLGIGNLSPEVLDVIRACLGSPPGA